MPGLLEHLLLHLEPVTEEDDDQCDRREHTDEIRRRAEIDQAKSAVTKDESDQHRGGDHAARMSEALVEKELRVEQERGRRAVDERAAGIETADAERQGHAALCAVERLPDEPVAAERVEPDPRLVFLGAIGVPLGLRAAARTPLAGDELERGERLVAGGLDSAAAEAGQRQLEAAAFEARGDQSPATRAGVVVDRGCPAAVDLFGGRGDSQWKPAAAGERPGCRANLLRRPEGPNAERERSALLDAGDLGPDHPLAGRGVPPDLRATAVRRRVLAPAARLAAEAAAARVDAREERAGARRRQLAAVLVTDLEQHAVATACVVAGVDRPVALVRQPRDLRRRRLLGQYGGGGGTISAEDGAHGACLVPIVPGV